MHSQAQSWKFSPEHADKTLVKISQQNRHGDKIPKNEAINQVKFCSFQVRAKLQIMTKEEKKKHMEGMN
jgi:hypothetical protein